MPKKLPAYSLFNTLGPWLYTLYDVMSLTAEGQAEFHDALNDPVECAPLSDTDFGDDERTEARWTRNLNRPLSEQRSRSTGKSRFFNRKC